MNYTTDDCFFNFFSEQSNESRKEDERRRKQEEYPPLSQELLNPHRRYCEWPLEIPLEDGGHFLRWTLLRFYDRPNDVLFNTRWTYLTPYQRSLIESLRKRAEAATIITN